MGPIPARSGPSVTPFSQQGLAGDTWKQWDMSFGTLSTVFNTLSIKRKHNNS